MTWMVFKCLMCGADLPRHSQYRARKRGYGYCSYACDAASKTKASEEDVLMRVLSRVEMRGDDECWPFSGRLSSNGYGVIDWGGRPYAAHRLMYKIGHLVMPPDGLFVCHSCDNPRCCNPGHLWLGTAADNNRDRDMKGRTRTRSLVGAQHHAAKLAEEDIIAIRESAEQNASIAMRYGVTAANIYRIRSRKTWRHV